MRTSDMLQLGKAGEYLTCADLILKGFIAFPSEQGLPYDVLLDTGKKLLKVQVKTTEQPRVVGQRKNETNCYIFNIKRHGKNNQNVYSDYEVDLFALVCIDTMKVGYIKNGEMPSTINIRVDDLKGSYYDEKGMKDYEKVKELNKTISSQTKIANKLNLHVAQVNRMLKSGYEPHQTGAMYFNDIIRENQFFYDL